MHIVLGVLTLVAAAMTATAAVMGGGPGSVGISNPGSGLKQTTLTLDLASFIIGFIVGIAALWLSRVEWSAIPHAVITTLRTWRRNMIFFGLAVASAGVLLFY